MAVSRYVRALPFLLLCIGYAYADLAVSAGDIVCQTTVNTTYVLPNGQTVTQDVPYWIVTNSADLVYTDIWTPNNGAAIYLAKQPQSGDSWQAVVWTCNDTSVTLNLLAYTARTQLYNLGSTNYVIEYWASGAFACSSSALSCDDSLGCVYDGTYSESTYYLYSEDEMRFLTAVTGHWDIDGTLAEGQTITVRWPIYTVRDITVSLCYRQGSDSSWTCPVSNQPVSAGTTTTLSFNVDLGANERGDLELKAEVRLNDTTDGACNDYFTSVSTYSVTDRAPEVTITAPTESTSSDVTITISYSSAVDPVEKYEIYVDGSLYDSQSAPDPLEPFPSYTFDYTITGLSDGTHTIEVKVYENPNCSLCDNDVSTASATVTVNTSSGGGSGGGLDGWTYRRPITINNSTGSELTDFQVRIDLDSTNFDFSKAASDGSDIRFTTDDGTTEIPYWIEKWDSQNQEAVIWVKVPSIPANGSTTIYMYYGNPSAISQSDGEAVFDFFDDFDTLDASWENHGYSTAEIVDGWLHLYATQDSQIYNTAYTIADGIIEARAKIVNREASSLISRVQDTSNFYLHVFNKSSSDTVEIFSEYKKVNGTYSSLTASQHYGSDIPVNTPFIERAIVVGSTIAAEIVADDYTVKTTVTASDSTFSSGHIGFRGYGAAGDNGEAYVDWIRVRKYADPEPTASVGAEESTSTTCPSGTVTLDMQYDVATASLKYIAWVDDAIEDGGTLSVCDPDTGSCVDIQEGSYYYESVDLGTHCRYAHYARATDGCTYDSDQVCVTVADEVAPNISITTKDSTGTPTTTFNAGDTVTLEVTVTDNYDPDTALTVSADIDGTAITLSHTDGTDLWTAIINTSNLDYGDHIITVTATDTSGNSTTKTATISIADHTAPTIAIDAVDESSDGSTWTAYDGSIEEGQYIRITYTASDNDGIDHVEVKDNGTVVTTLTTASGSYSWQVSGTGTHTIEVIAYDPSGNVASDSTTVEVVAATQPYVTADFTWTPSVPVINQEVTFNDASTVSDCGNITTSEWDIGCDGTVDGTGSQFTYTFTSAGDYCVQHDVATDGGCSGSIQKTVTVGDEPATTDTDFNITMDDDGVSGSYLWSSDRPYRYYIAHHIKACKAFDAEAIYSLYPDNYITGYFYLSDVKYGGEQLPEEGMAIFLDEFTLPRNGTVSKCVDISAPEGFSEYALMASYLKYPEGYTGKGATTYLYIKDSDPVILLLYNCPLQEYEDGVFKLKIPLYYVTGKLSIYYNGTEVVNENITSDMKAYEFTWAADVGDTIEVKVYPTQYGGYAAPAVCTYTVGIPSVDEIYSANKTQYNPIVEKLNSKDIVFLSFSGFTPSGIAVTAITGERKGVFTKNVEWLIALAFVFVVFGAWRIIRRFTHG